MDLWRSLCWRKKAWKWDHVLFEWRQIQRWVDERFATWKGTSSWTRWVFLQRRLLPRKKTWLRRPNMGWWLDLSWRMVEWWKAWAGNRDRSRWRILSRYVGARCETRFRSIAVGWGYNFWRCIFIWRVLWDLRFHQILSLLMILYFLGNLKL